ncbi:hypothetical protein BCR34DRAFT_157433 [Clohesyomyces aquaticus]|uniref:Uncharacterized protein n=1 Tax=Clohesyomyces aquaticus TaxID=1231657 RepID=A0A1Y1YJT7_9PLEO|nr:hypothetical protein BCR34DRAFT_157433 [Clohesyomyces aquaticus]
MANSTTRPKLCHPKDRKLKQVLPIPSVRCVPTRKPMQRYPSHLEPHLLIAHAHNTSSVRDLVLIRQTQVLCNSQKDEQVSPPFSSPPRQPATCPPNQPCPMRPLFHIAAADCITDLPPSLCRAVPCRVVSTRNLPPFLDAFSLHYFRSTKTRGELSVARAGCTSVRRRRFVYYQWASISGHAWLSTITERRCRP